MSRPVNSATVSGAMPLANMPLATFSTHSAMPFSLPISIPVAIPCSRAVAMLFLMSR